LSEYILELKGITKIFPGVKALDKVHFQLKKGEVHALMGENGAGKSTFIKIITGVHQAEEGEMFFNGEKTHFKTPRDARKMGIAAIYQHVTCYPDLTVTENIFLGHEEVSPKIKRILWKEMHKKAGTLLKEIGADFTEKTLMGSLSVAQQQIVEIAKALSMDAKLIIMDEPTAALTKRECEELYNIIDDLKEKDVSIIFISHKFEDMYRVASRVTVFRDSQYIGNWNVDEISSDDLIVSMVGRQIDQYFPKKKSKIGEEVLSVKGLSKTGLFKDVSFNLKRGEIIGITGLVGAGRTEVCQTLFGIMKKDEGTVSIDGKEVRIRCPKDSMNQGIGYLPEDRQKEGLVMEWDIGRNITLSNMDTYSTNGWINESVERSISGEFSNKVHIKAQTIYDLVSSLSGGNQQKVIVAKLLALNPNIIIMDEPTKGVDVGAKSAIYQIMEELVEKGCSIIMISSEMLEVLGMSDRIYVMRDGRISGMLNRNEATQENILELAMLNKSADVQEL